jgi:hypothetical protein
VREKKNVLTTDSHEPLDEKTLRYLYHKIVVLMVGNKDYTSVFTNGKDRAYRDILGIISDILSN